jgi:hypothetical protein
MLAERGVLDLHEQVGRARELLALQNGLGRLGVRHHAADVLAEEVVLPVLSGPGREDGGQDLGQVAVVRPPAGPVGEPGVAGQVAVSRQG